jgi:hypothetical protein
VILEMNDETLSAVELLPEMAKLVSDLTEHIVGEHGLPRCGVVDFEPALLVEAALQSDCNDCRATLMIGPLGQLGCSLRDVPEWEPQPFPGAETMLEEKRKRDDGR